MAQHRPAPRTRPIAVGTLRAFEAVARHLNFRMAAEELSLTQSAVSRQIQALEDDVGLPLFLRHTRAVELTGAGSRLLRAVSSSLLAIDGTVRQLRHESGRRIVSVSTWASFASLWLIPRLEAFQRAHPDIDIRIDATDAPVDLETSDVDLALRYTTPARATSRAQRLFGESLAVVASPWLLKSSPALQRPADLAAFTLIEAGDLHHSPQLAALSWQRWFLAHDCPVEPRRWLYFNYASQIAQAALAGQGVALARLPLVADSLASGDLVEALPACRLESALAYWLLVGPRGAQRPEVKAFCDWLRAEAAITRRTIGDEPDPDTVDHQD
ncbi:LysR substrate-binding domain-containing protein [Xylophilus sp. GOD-11R]|uniref:LysR substrate-binding domain-containing protein n=1 Tax=Xylophilus sp. GOD-11R TaxID=3089814 RepID=UPI00298C048C|nr:LysR substrate-binding domain-containing protein [Xylophilus sp. GOD-11R]WPB56333.1 LysR substrate-binding domain-containing protein [Xylophilus sp. GOD-11R]